MLGTTLGTGLTIVAWSCFWRKRLKHPSQKLPCSRRGLNRQIEGGSLLFLTLPVAAPLLIRHVCWWDVPYFPSFLRLLLWFYICFSYFFFSFLTFFFKLFFLCFFIFFFSFCFYVYSTFYKSGHLRLGRLIIEVNFRRLAQCGQGNYGNEGSLR